MRFLVNNQPNNFDLIRLLMALLVVWSHAFALYLGAESLEPISIIFNAQVNAGQLGVDVFFIVSGFLITQSFYRSRSWASYLYKRIARIYPGYMAAIAICAFVLLPLYNGTKYDLHTIWESTWKSLLLRNWFIDPNPFVANPSPSLNGSLWSIPIEFWCYLGVLAYGITRLRRWFLIGLFALITIIQVWTVWSGKLWGGGLLNTIFGWPNFWFRMAPFFLAGMLCYQFRDELPRSGRLALLLPMSYLAAAWMLPLVAVAILPLLLAYLVLYFAFSPQLLSAAKWGDFSYGTYLYAFPAQQLLIATKRMNFPVFVGSSLLLSLGCGVVSWYLIERWFHRASEPIKALPV